jgi:cytochrome P450
LSQDQQVQAKLREELFTIDTDNPTMDQLNMLPYLDMILRETLRVHPVIPSIGRMAVKDDILPLSEPVIDRHGKVHENIRQVDLQQFHIVPLV